jgi:hypothetical protein
MIAKSEQSEQSRKSAIQTMGGIYDATGRLVQCLQLDATQMVNTIDIASLVSGVYTVRVLRNGVRSVTQKIVKQ